MVDMSATELTYAAARWVTYGSVLLAFGVAVFLAAIHDGRASELRVQGGLIVGGALLGSLSTIAEVCLHASEISSGDALLSFERRTFIASIESVVGLAAITRLVGITLLLIGVAWAFRGGRSWAPVVGGALAALSFVLAGHTATADPRWLAYVAGCGHLIAAGIWFGGLVALTVMLRRRRSVDDAIGGARLIARFSAWATGALLLVLLGGLALTWVEIRSFEQLTQSGYGRTLGLKVALVVLVIAMGGYNNRKLVPTIARVWDDGQESGPLRAWERLGTTVRLEVVGIVAVLAVTAFLVETPPPRDEGAGGHMATDASTTFEEAAT